MLAIGILATTAIVAEAARVPNGRYVGKTLQGADVSFRVLRESVEQFRAEEVSGRCTDGERRSFGEFVTPRGRRFPLDDAGRFSAFGRVGEDTLGVDLDGQIRGKRATGTLRLFAKINRDEEIDPNGRIRCDTGRMRWNR